MTYLQNEQYFYTDTLSVGYNGKALIENINMRLKRGEILTLIGPNGAGKSTILKSITKQLSLISGCVYIDGLNMSDISEKELSTKLSVVLTDRINPELMTCYDVVATGRYPYTGRLGILSESDKKKVFEAMERVEALELADRDFLNISDGQRQRIFLARAICQEPEIIVLDEPTSFLDIRHKLELLSILKNMVKKNNIAVIMSLHELDLAQKISDFVICVNDGRIEKCGEPEEIFSEEYIQKLYNLTKGSYNSFFGCLEMDRNTGEPEIFIIGGNSSAGNIYRKIWRKGIPFATGVLHENDVDYQIAKALASKVVSQPAFEPISDENLNKAVEIASKCRKICCPLKSFGILNEKNSELLEKVLALGVEICYDL